MLFLLQNIDSARLICKIFQNKELEAVNQPESRLAAIRKCYLFSYYMLSEECNWEPGTHLAALIPIILHSVGKPNNCGVSSVTVVEVYFLSRWRSAKRAKDLLRIHHGQPVGNSLHRHDRH